MWHNRNNTAPPVFHPHRPVGGELPFIDLKTGVRAARDPTTAPYSFGSSEFRDSHRTGRSYVFPAPSQYGENALMGTTDSSKRASSSSSSSEKKSEGGLCSIPGVNLFCWAWDVSTGFVGWLAEKGLEFFVPDIKEWWQCFLTTWTAIFHREWDYFKSDAWTNCKAGFYTFTVMSAIIAAAFTLLIFGTLYFAGSTIFNAGEFGLDAFRTVFDVFFKIFGFVYTGVKDFSSWLFDHGVSLIEFVGRGVKIIAELTHSSELLWYANFGTALAWAAIELVTETVNAELWFMKTTGYRIYRFINTPIRFFIDKLHDFAGPLLAQIAQWALLPVMSIEFVISFLVGLAVDGIRSLFSKGKKPLLALQPPSNPTPPLTSL